MSRFLRSVQQSGLLNTVKRVSRFHEIHEGNLVGTDALGNKYFEQPAKPAGQQRWVELANPDLDASAVPAEWHAWMHYIADKPLEMPKPHFAKEHIINPTGTEKAYFPTNHIANRSTYKGAPDSVQTWQPQ